MQTSGKRDEWYRGALLALLTATLGACSSAESSTAQSKPKLPVAFEGGPLSAVCGAVEVDGELEPRLFMLTAMNHKLAAFPDFAASIGLDSVSDCESGQRFVDGYVAYRADHPDFDLDEPLDTTDYPRTMPPPDQESVMRAQKMLRGVPGLNNPVVRVDFHWSENSDSAVADFSGHGKFCSGTFIAKNWILTAAHCITGPATDNCVKAGVPPTDIFNCTPDWLNYTTWTISFKRTDGTIATVETGGVNYVHPAWLGKNLAHNPDTNPLLEGPIFNEVLPDFPDHDVALIYIPDDRVLPPHVEEDGAKRISVVPPQLAWTYDFFGWGTNPLGPEPDLRKSVNRPDFTIDTNTISSTVTAVDQSTPCGGDSGGPLVRTVNVDTNEDGVQTEQVIVGVLSLGSATKAECHGNVNPVVGRVGTWSRVDVNYNFIEDTIRRWNGNPIREDSGFRCALRPVEGEGSADQVAECWGTPCEGDGDCLKSEYCSRPGQEFSSCPTCQDFQGQGIGPCGCIVGQCLPNPNFVEDDGTTSGP